MFKKDYQELVDIPNNYCHLTAYKAKSRCDEAEERDWEYINNQ